jgi:hypothetical protein
VRAELGVTVGNLAPSLVTSGLVAASVLGVPKFPHRLREGAGTELARQPAVKARQELIFAKVDGPGGWSVLFLAAYWLRNTHR